MCPMCISGVMQCNTVTEKEKTRFSFEQHTHIYVCDDCPFIGFEFYNDTNTNALINYLNGNNHEELKSTKATE